MDADAIIAAINSGGMWFGGVDGAIQRSAGSHFHQQAAEAMPLKDGQTIIASGSGGSIKNVVFVVDNLERPLSEVVLSGLTAADKAGFQSVALPTIRMGVMLGVLEASDAEVYDQMRQGVASFVGSNPENIDEIIFVVYNDTEMESSLKSVMAKFA